MLAADERTSHRRITKHPSVSSQQKPALGDKLHSRALCMRKTLIRSCALLLSPHRLAAQALPADSLFDRLIGHWVLRGTIARQQTTHDVTLEQVCLPVARQHGRSGVDPAGTGRGSMAGDSIPFLFHYSAADRFHTTFAYNRAGDSWQWHMDNDSSGVRRPLRE
jgi:hypothetical protein